MITYLIQEANEVWHKDLSDFILIILPPKLVTYEVDDDSPLAE